MFLTTSCHFFDYIVIKPLHYVKLIYFVMSTNNCTKRAFNSDSIYKDLQNCKVQIGLNAVVTYLIRQSIYIQIFIYYLNAVVLCVLSNKLQIHMNIYIQIYRYTYIFIIWKKQFCVFFNKLQVYIYIYKSTNIHMYIFIIWMQ